MGGGQVCRTKLRMSSEFFESFFGSFTAAGGMVFELVAEDGRKFLTSNKHGNGFFLIEKNNQRLLSRLHQADIEKRGVVPADISLADDFELFHGGERMNQKWVQVKQEFVIEREFSFGGTEP